MLWLYAAEQVLYGVSLNRILDLTIAITHTRCSHPQHGGVHARHLAHKANVLLHHLQLFYQEQHTHINRSSATGTLRRSYFAATTATAQ